MNLNRILTMLEKMGDKLHECTKETIKQDFNDLTKDDLEKIWKHDTEIKLQEMIWDQMTEDGNWLFINNPEDNKKEKEL